MITRPIIESEGASQTEECWALLVYLLLGIAFGIVLTNSEVLSWFRIQEMFRFQSFRLYGIIGTAIATAAISLALIKRLRLKSFTGESISVPPKQLGHGVRYAVGGTIFCLGWALTGACPGPLFALIGDGVSVMIVAVLCALLGTWIYGLLRPRGTGLPRGRVPNMNAGNLPCPSQRTRPRNKSSNSYKSVAAELAEIGRDFYARGWVLGSSGNFSAVLHWEPLRLAITSTGVDQQQ